ncbi:MAG: hypothetical protein ACKVS8_10445 [Phycisphaerales bacterium]
MCNRCLAACVAVAAGSLTALPALAQDSVSTGNGLPGDAVSAYAAGATATGEQRNDFVVDLVVKNSSWGTGYRFGALMKGSSGGASFFTTLVAANALSNRYTFGPMARSTYQAWATAGQGVSNANNSAPADNGSGLYGPIDTSSLQGTQFGAAFMEFGGGPNGTFGDGDDENNIIAGIIGFNNLAPDRLFVSRTNAAVNKPSASAGLTSTASLGLGGVDEAGNVHLLADNFGLVSGSAIADKRFIRINAATRTTALNQLQNLSYGDAANTRTLLGTSTTTLTVPTIISSLLASRPIMIGGDFSNNYQFEGVVNTMSTSTAYLPAGGSPRGPISFTAQPFAQINTGVGDLGAAAVLSRDSVATRTRGISAWGVNSNGSVDGAQRYQLPTASGQIVDAVDGFDPIAIWGSGSSHEFCNFASQVSFRGGSGPVAMTVLSGGDLLLAATVSPNNTAPSQVPQSMDNYIAVARVNAGTGIATWHVAAHTGNVSGAAGGLSKAILGADMDTVGRLARYNEVVPGATSGPSLSSPAMDRLGNLYFLATVVLTPEGGPNVLTTGLIRANFDEATNGYQLELLTQAGDTFAGRNSQRNYQIQFMGTADGDSVDSGAIFSGSIVQDINRHVPQGLIGYGNANSLGALVVRAKIVYDRNNDGLFLDPTVAGNAGQPDQAYNVAMIVMPEYNPIDYNIDRVINPDDLGDYITAYYSEELTTDYNDDGVINPDDLGDYITAYFSV